MSLYTSLLKPLFFTMDAERAHALAFAAMRLADGALLGMLAPKPVPDAPVTVAGLRFRNRVGLAAGFDKNAEATPAWHRLGFGHVEVGTVTPRPQAGNPRPRLFRLPIDEALINRMGFNNAGAEAVRRNLERDRPPAEQMIIGGNIGKMKETAEADAFRDYIICLEALHEAVDYFTVNISSPNTPGLRDLQRREPLWRLLGELQNRNQKLGTPRPIFVKLAPDLTEVDLLDLALVAQETGCAGVVATNTTLGRTGLQTPAPDVERLGAGGLSGKPLASRAAYFTQILGKAAPKELAIISCGGIASAPEAQARIDAGASLVQIYTGLVYKGAGLVSDLARLKCSEQDFIDALWANSI